MVVAQLKQAQGCRKAATYLTAAIVFLLQIFEQQQQQQQQHAGVGEDDDRDQDASNFGYLLVSDASSMSLVAI